MSSSPFVRFSRDKRGYEYIYLVHAPSSRGTQSRPRVLYWYRTPPDVKVGRQPFDETLRVALEAQNPNVSFDWKQILEAQAPPPLEVEPWRERRRAERSAKQAQSAARLDQTVDVAEPPDVEPPEADQVEADGGGEVGPPMVVADGSGAVAASPEADTRSRRRRRGGRRARRIGDGASGGSTEPPDEPAARGPDEESRIQGDKDTENENP